MCNSGVPKVYRYVLSQSSRYHLLIHILIRHLIEGGEGLPPPTSNHLSWECDAKKRTGLVNLWKFAKKIFFIWSCPRRQSVAKVEVKTPKQLRLHFCFIRPLNKKLQTSISRISNHVFFSHLSFSFRSEKKCVFFLFATL